MMLAEKVDAELLDSALSEIPDGKITSFSFDEVFQDKIVAMMLRDTSFMQRIEGLIQPSYFSEFSNQIICSVVLRYYKKYKKSPGDKVIFVTAMADDVKGRLLKKEDIALVIDRIKGTDEDARNPYLMDVSDRDYVVEMVASFARHQAVEIAILKSAEILETTRDFDMIQKRISEAITTGANLGDTGYDYGDEIDSRTAERKDVSAGLIKPDGISTGYEAFDNVLYHKGWGRSELTVIMGAAKAGKSLALLSFAVNALAKGFNVLYVTLEVSSKIISSRIDANIANYPIEDLASTHIIDTSVKVKEFVKRSGKLKIHEFPTGTMRPSDLTRLYNKYKSQGLNFDLIVVDYADLMMPEHHSDSAIENSKSIYINLRGFAMQEKIALLTATQTNREGAKATVAKMTDVAEDFNKIRIADLVISINKTDEERAAGEARLYFAASRNQKGDFSLRIQQDVDRMKFCTAVLGKDS